MRRGYVAAAALVLVALVILDLLTHIPTYLLKILVIDLILRM